MTLTPLVRRLMIFLDGTWNDSADQTNVYRFARSVHDWDGSIEQKTYYDPGVGTEWGVLRKFVGGVSGYGTTGNILQAYEWLANNYRAGDEVWVFGFSRGAYAARSLVGMIRKCGLLDIVTDKLLERVSEQYTDQVAEPKLKAFREKHSSEIDIHFLGVWDTVGALGIPGMPALSEHGLFSWHDTSLWHRVKHAYHAVALDEHREAYKACLWTGEATTGQQVEQCWFSGAHANVGGGYPDDPLADIALRWMQDKAVAAGLKLNLCEPAEDAYLAPVTDSYEEFLGGVYALTQGDEGRYKRPRYVSESGDKYLNVRVHDSVLKRSMEGVRASALTP
ncbi:DUF2235 domain-containing protein [Biformimicrobium ophioploci]|uniref:DUF2235 domain-containing protein n=2 Tax=Biformimicrobium ophioploci TaxID=3036711 RepID=A0ABQ6LWX8_9GAMM|nr:DUF2235 domain-containing protein [Microbulbifer sp. NKW57]